MKRKIFLLFCGFAVAFLAYGQNVHIVGALDMSGNANQTWSFDGSNWTPEAQLPVPIYGASMLGNTLFEGVSPQGYYDGYQDYMNGSWSVGSDTIEHLTEIRRDYACIKLGDSYVVVGGYGTENSPLIDGTNKVTSGDYYLNKTKLVTFDGLGGVDCEIRDQTTFGAVGRTGLILTADQNGSLHAIGGAQNPSTFWNRPPYPNERWTSIDSGWTWVLTDSSALPDGGRAYATAPVEIGGTLYLFGGLGDSGPYATWLYSTDSGVTWMLGGTAPFSRWHAEAAVLGVNIYIFPGYSNTAPIPVLDSMVWKFDPATQTFSQVGQAPFAVKEYAVTTTLLATSVTELAITKPAILAYPVPTSGQVDFTEPLTDVTVHAPDGRLVMRAERAQRLDFSNLASSIYVVRGSTTTDASVVFRIQKE